MQVFKLYIKATGNYATFHATFGDNQLQTPLYSTRYLIGSRQWLIQKVARKVTHLPL